MQRAWGRNSWLSFSQGCRHLLEALGFSSRQVRSLLLELLAFMFPSASWPDPGRPQLADQEPRGPSRISSAQDGAWPAVHTGCRIRAPPPFWILPPLPAQEESCSGAPAEIDPPIPDF